jgi:hypothetical protein
MYRSMILASLLCSIFPFLAVNAADKVYKTRDKDGNVVFSDVPPATAVEAEKAAIEVRETNTYEPGGGRKSGIGDRQPWIVDENDEGEPEFIPYSTLQVIAPLNDTPLRDNTGNVSVQLSVEPALAGGHRLRVLMDGKTVGEDGGLSFSIKNVDRGTHSLVVQVLDAEGKVMQTSEPSTFHMQRFHLPPKKPTKKPPGKPAPPK